MCIWHPGHSYDLIWFLQQKVQSLYRWDDWKAQKRLLVARGSNIPQTPGDTSGAKRRLSDCPTVNSKERKSKLQLHKCQYKSSGLGLLQWMWQYIFLLCFHIYFLSTLGLGCISQDLSWLCADFSLVAACGLQSQSLLSCLQECTITVPWPGVKPAWQGGLLTTGPPGKFLAVCFKGS